MMKWTEVSISAILASVKELYSRDKGGNDEASHEKMAQNLRRITGGKCSKASVRRYVSGDKIPRENMLSAEHLNTYLLGVGGNRAIIKGRLQEAKRNSNWKELEKNESELASMDSKFRDGILTALTTRGYDVEELRKDSREELCERLAKAARETGNAALDERSKKKAADKLAGLPPKKPLLADGDLVEEGTLIMDPHPCFPKREDHGGDLFAAYYHSIRTQEGRHKVPYKELFGHQGAGRKEYTEGENLIFSYEDFTVDYATRVTSCDFELARKEKELAAAQMGYMVHPPKLCLVDYLEKRAEDTNGGESQDTLGLTFGTCAYLDNLVWRDELQKNQVEQDAFRRVLASSPKEHLAGFGHGPWAAAGGGTWVTTSDGYLVMSFRSPTRVGEVAGRLGYSASGSFGRYTTDEKGIRRDQTPGGAMVKELEEELGLQDVKPEDLTQISLGLDLERGLAQWSYLLESSFTADDVTYFRQDWATTADEQTVFFVPFDTPDVCYRLLAECEWEPGAAFSLFRLITKRFGPL